MRLKVKHFEVLECLRQAGEGVSCATVAEFTGKSVSGAYSPLEELVRYGWVSRRVIGERVFYSLSEETKRSSGDQCLT
jgi:DNA-binding IclR family transcriptional regulator